MLKKITIKNVLSILLIILFFIAGVSVIMGIMGIPYALFEEADKNAVASLIGMLAVGISYLMIIVSLIDIVNSSKVNIFISENVRRFKRIGYLLFASLILKYILAICNLLEGMTILDAVPNTEIYIIAALLCFVIADAFDKAIKIKEENEFTV